MPAAGRPGPESWKARHIAADGRVAVTVLVRRGPAERQATACVLEIVPAGAFRTFGIGVSLRTMLDPPAAQARVPVSQ